MVLLALFVAALFLYIVATLYHADHLFFMAAVMVSLPLISYALSVWALSRLRFSLGMRGRTTLHENQTSRLSLLIVNAGRLPVCYWGWQPELPEGLALEASQAAGVVCLMARQSTAFDCSIQAVRRGIYRLEEAVVMTSDLLGLFQFRRVIRGFSAEVVVYPEVHAISRPPLGLSQIAFGEGTPRSNAAPGEGVDFYGIREYRPGDELRRIHWLSTAKTGQLVVVEFEETPAQDLTVVLDLQTGPNPGHGRERPFEYAVRLAASIGVATLRTGRSLRLVAQGARDRSLLLRGAPEDTAALLETLAEVEADGSQPIDQVLRNANGHFDAGATVIITSQLTSHLVEAVAHQVERGAPPIVALIESPSFEDSSEAGAQPVVARQEPIRRAWGDAPLTQQLTAYGAQVRRIRRGENLASAAEAL